MSLRSSLTVPEAVGLGTARLEKIRAWAQKYIDDGKLPNALTLVSRYGKLAFLDVRGNRDVAKHLPLEEDTIFRVYSMTKPICAVATLMCYEDGHFQLDDPIHKFIPEFAKAKVVVGGSIDSPQTVALKSPITIQHLLTHTSGICYGKELTDHIAGRLQSKIMRAARDRIMAARNPLEEHCKALAECPLISQPGEEWNYGQSIDVCGRIVEVVSGMTLEQFMTQRIFKPLRMKDTGFTVSGDKLGRFAALYAFSPNESGREQFVQVPEPAAGGYRGQTLFEGGAGLTSTAADYLRFGSMLANYGELDGVRLLSRKTVELMTMNHLPGGRDMAAMGQASFSEMTMRGVGFGLGVSVMLDPAKAAILGTPGEFYWGGAASTAFWCDPTEGMIVIFMTQLLPSSKYPLRRQLRVATYQSIVDGPRAAWHGTAAPGPRSRL